VNTFGEPVPGYQRNRARCLTVWRFLRLIIDLPPISVFRFFLFPPVASDGLVQPGPPS